MEEGRGVVVVRKRWTTELGTRPSDPPESTCSPAWREGWPCREERLGVQLL